MATTIDDYRQSQSQQQALYQSNQPAATTPNYAIGYNDPRFQKVDADKQAALQQSNQQFDQMIGQTDQYYQGQIDAVNDYEQTQTQLQQERTDFTIEKIEQQKDKAHKDYIWEQQGAYADWQKQSDPYGVNAERMAMQGMQGTGFSESSQVRMWSAYQNRVAMARESYNNAVLDYDNGIKEARLANSSALAEISANALKERLGLALEGFQYKNDLTMRKMDTQRQIDSEYYGRWKDVQEQINQENAMAEQIRQFNEGLAQDDKHFYAGLEQNDKFHQDEMDYKYDSLGQDDKHFYAGLDEERRQFDESHDLEEREFAESVKQWAAEFGLSEKEFLQRVAEFEKTFAFNEKTHADDMAYRYSDLLQGQNQFETTMDYNKGKDVSDNDKWLMEYNANYGTPGKQTGTANGSGGSGGSGGETAPIIPIIKGNDVKAPTQAQQKTYTTFETNIGNMMLKNPSKSTKSAMQKQLLDAVNNNKITAEQYYQLLSLMS